MGNAAPPSADDANRAAGAHTTGVLRWVLIIACLSAVFTAGWAYLRFFGNPEVRMYSVLGAVCGLLAIATSVAGGVTVTFYGLTRRSYEWFLAWRYLRIPPDTKRPSGALATVLVGLSLLTIAIALWGVSFWIARRGGGLLTATGGYAPMSYELGYAAIGFVAVGLGVLLFGVLSLARFSLFTVISLVATMVALGAPVLVLSMMGGFEHDIRNKILGATSHVVVSQRKGNFPRDEAIERLIEQTPGVVAASPYLEGEVMITSQTNLSSVLLHGIDPARAAKVSDLEKHLRAQEGEGSLRNLLEPERLAKVPDTQVRPMVSPPMGPDTDEPLPAESHQGRHKGTRGAESPQSNEDQPADEPKADRAGSSAAQAQVNATAKANAIVKDQLGENVLPKPSATIKRAREQRGNIIVETESWDATDEVGKRVNPRPVLPGILIGAELAKMLRVYVGDDVNVVSPDGAMSPAGPIPKARPFRVAGVFYTGLYEYDNKYAYVLIAEAQRFLGTDNEITGVEIRAASRAAALEVADSVRASLSGRDFTVEDWRQRNVSLFNALEIERVVMAVVLIFILLVASFCIVTNLSMVVLRKVREIGALKAIGATHLGVLKTFLYAGLYIGLIGSLAGVLWGLLMCELVRGMKIPSEIYYISQLPIRVATTDVLGLVGLGLLISLLATLYPSISAASLKPVDGMRRHDL